MPFSPNLNIEHLANNSVQPEVPVNAATDALDTASNASLVWSLSGNQTVTQDQLASAWLHILSGSPGGTFEFNLPAGVERMFGVKNESGETATVQVTGGAGANVSVANGVQQILHSDGADVIGF